MVLYRYSGVIVKFNSYTPMWCCKGNKPVLQLLATITLSMLMPYVNAAEVTKSASISTGIDFDSNPAYSSTKKDPVWVYSLIPQFRLDVNQEVNRWYIDGALTIQRYSNESVLVNREDPRVAVGWDRTYDSGMFGVRAEYQERSSRIAEVQNTGEFLTLDNTQKTKVLAAKWQHAISSRLGVLTEGDYNDITYSVPGVLESYKYADIRSQLTYANSETLETFAQIGYAQLHPDATFDGTDFARLKAGANYQISTGFSLSAYGGIYNLSGRQSNTDWLLGLKTDKVVDRASYSVGLSRDMVPTGVGGFRQADSFRAAWTFNATEANKIGAEYQFDRYRKDPVIFVEGLRFQQVLVFYDRILNNHWNTRISATHKVINNPTNIQDNIVGFSLVYNTLDF